MKNNYRFPYKWYLKDNYNIENIEQHNLKVFSTFACGGGSTMGYKLAGYDVIGANDIDIQMAKVYKENHNPKYYFHCPINELLNNNELPKELYNLDILDGSPPCSTFSTAGQREKSFKKEKKFREGQAKQVLSDLFFDYIDLAKKLKPKVIIAENVKGMLLGNAKSYTKQVFQKFNEIGYNTQLFLLNSATMGVPQRRERIFFIASRKDLNLSKLNLEFNEKSIIFKEIKENININNISLSEYEIWKKRNKKDLSLASTLVRLNRKYNRFTTRYIFDNKVLTTITAADNNILYSTPRHLTRNELCLCGSFPLDYNFLNVKPKYLIGMSVPPVMIANIVYEIYKQWFKNNINNNNK